MGLHAWNVLGILLPYTVCHHLQERNLEPHQEWVETHKAAMSQKLEAIMMTSGGPPSIAVNFWIPCTCILASNTSHNSGCIFPVHSHRHTIRLHIKYSANVCAVKLDMNHSFNIQNDTQHERDILTAQMICSACLPQLCWALAEISCPTSMAPPATQKRCAALQQ